MNSWLDRFDQMTERKSRAVAQSISRRSVFTGMGRLLVASAFSLPILPFDRTSQALAAERNKKKPDIGESDCDYWRYCAVDGFLCSCCGGTATTCPPGTSASKVAWVGTCHNPLDGKDYLLSYNDCCGRTSCGRCMCNTNSGDRPGYRMGVHNDVNWCMSNDSSAYHCTTSVIVGVAEAN